MAGGGIKQISNFIRGGADGITYTPEVRSDGKLYFVANKGGAVIGGFNIKGADGADGISPSIKNGYWWIGNMNTNVKAEGKDGAKGADGGRIVSQEFYTEDESGGYVYKQTFDDGTVAYFTAPKGQQGIQGIQGERGDNGLTPFIGNNGNWWIGSTDTGVFAQCGFSVTYDEQDENLIFGTN